MGGDGGEGGYSVSGNHQCNKVLKFPFKQRFCRNSTSNGSLGNGKHSFETFKTHEQKRSQNFCDC